MTMTDRIVMTKDHRVASKKPCLVKPTMKFSKPTQVSPMGREKGSEEIANLDLKELMKMKRIGPRKTMVKNTKMA